MTESIDDFNSESMTPIDTNYDGIIDSVASEKDLNEDGFSDSLMLIYDENSDGILDSYSLIADLDSDGNIDFAEYGFDSDGDGSMDSSFTGIDTDGDFEPDLFTSIDSSGSIWGDVDFTSGTDATEFVSPEYSGEEDSLATDFAAYNEVHGSPIEDMALWDQQDDPMSCAVATANMMFRTAGLDVGESEIAAVFESQGIYDPNSGTDPYLIDDVINDMAINNNLNIHAEEINGFTPQSLEEMLDQGVRPLVGVDSSELYGNGNRLLNEMGLIPDTGHAVQVTGIVHNEEGDFVVINDPGFPEGAGQMIPMGDFMGASEDFGNTAVAMMEGAPPSYGNDYHWAARAGMRTAVTLAMGTVTMALSSQSRSKIQPNEK